MKGIILAGGHGTRLFPMTKVLTKQLQPIYDKPMIYYPLSLLMLAGIREIMLISSPQDLPYFEQLLSNGSLYGLKIHYKIQEAPKGIAEAFILAEDFIQNDNVTLILGDNFFYGDIEFFRAAVRDQEKNKDIFRCRIFGYPVADPERYGIVDFDKKTYAIKSIEEKPQKPLSNYAIPGLYVFDSTAANKAKKIKPSPRGELEITDLILSYHQDDLCRLYPITRGVAWLDMGTPKSLVEASQYVMSIEDRQGLKIACLEEIAFRMGFIDLNQFIINLNKLPKSPYKKYLEDLIQESSHHFLHQQNKREIYEL